jgi:glycosyltransferase involved in cell wall biosynthesis
LHFATVSDNDQLIMNLPLVSICIPTYNAAEFLEPCLLSALGQTYPNIEILICDDGSKDSTMEIVNKFYQQHSHIRIVQNSTNSGMVNNWNYCIEQAQGEWIKFLFQDDLLEPDCVGKMLAACNQFDVQVSLCRRDFILHDDILPHLRRDFSEGGISKAEQVFGNKLFISPEQLAEAVKHHLVQNFLGEPTCYLFHKNLCKEAGFFNTDLRQVVDYEFIVRLGLVKGLAFIPATLAHFRVHGKSESSANNQKNNAAQIRNFAAESGDCILLLYHYLHHPAFAKVREATGSEVLDTYIKHLYYSGCKHNGKKLVNEALEPIRTAYPELGAMNYNFFKYVHYRKRFKKWEKENRN